MTVRDWIARRAPPPPPALTEQVLALLGADADASESRAGELCLAAATRSLDALLSENRFGRDSALELLAIDALTTYAFEHASLSMDREHELASLTERGTHMLGQLVTQRA